MKCILIERPTPLGGLLRVAVRIEVETKNPSDRTERRIARGVEFLVYDGVLRTLSEVVR